MELGGDPRLRDRRVTEWFLLERARREHASQAKQMPTRSALPPTITISRQYGAGGHTIGCALAETLGAPWQVWDREIIEAVARSAEVRTEMVESLDERTQSWMDEMIHSLFNVQMMETLAYRRHLAQVLLALAQQGHKILLGRGANFVLPDALNVRLYASFAYRARQMAERLGVSVEEAERRLHHVDRERAEFTRSVYGRDLHDPMAYDLMLNTEALTERVGVSILASAADAIFGKAA